MGRGANAKQGRPKGSCGESSVGDPTQTFGSTCCRPCPCDSAQLNVCREDIIASGVHAPDCRPKHQQHARRFTKREALQLSGPALRRTQSASRIASSRPLLHDRQAHLEGQRGARTPLERAPGTARCLKAVKHWKGNGEDKETIERHCVDEVDGASRIPNRILSILAAVPRANERGDSPPRAKANIRRESAIESFFLMLGQKEPTVAEVIEGRGAPRALGIGGKTRVG